MTTQLASCGRGAALAALVLLSSAPALAQIATVPAAAAARESSMANDRVTFISGAQTMAAFEKGQPLTETATYKVHASRREAAGLAEVHARDTDVIYVLEGRATVVTGGTVVDGKAIAADELRGTRIEGGMSRTLAKGDVLIVPEGVPHWFSDVKGTLLYYVVKVTVPAGATPEATIDLATRAGVQLVKGQWRYSDTRIIEIDFAGPGPDGQPTGAPGRTYDYTPKAGPADFDDSQWDVIDPTTLTQRRSTGRICFNWYRIAITIPERIGGYDPAGADVELETALDDYAEIWVDGELPRALGQEGGSVIAGWNATNRLVIGRGVQPGQRIQLAVFGINGPLSNPPTNYIWMRHARLNFRHGAQTAAPIAVTPQEVNVDVLRRDADAMQAIVGANPKIFKLAEGFAFTEGPVWVPALDSLLFSDPNRNTIYRYSKENAGVLSVFRANSGYAGANVADYKQPGSNGLALDSRGRLTINEHGNRRVTRLDATAITAATADASSGTAIVLADRYDGNRLNSPNDLVYRSDGALFFTDPPFGLPKVFDDPRKELSFSGVYMLKDGKLRVIATDLTGPNGIALSPDERFLYVGNWDDARKVVMRYEATGDGGYDRGTVLFDMTAAPGEDAIDGIKVDVEGHLYVSGPGGLWVLSPDGRHLGTIAAPRHIHNMAWGDDDRKTLYLCARDRLYRMRVNIAGAGLSAPAASAAPSSARR